MEASAIGCLDIIVDAAGECGLPWLGISSFLLLQVFSYINLILELINISIMVYSLVLFACCVDTTTSFGWY
jgi:hypothetical protein